MHPVPLGSDRPAPHFPRAPLARLTASTLSHASGVADLPGCLDPPVPPGRPCGLFSGVSRLSRPWVPPCLLPRLPMADTPPDYSPGDATPAAPASESPAAAPSTPPWLLSNTAPSPPACPSTDACPVCLCEFPSHAHGPESPFHWPSCGHTLHLGCVARLVANVRELRCPTCRAPWPPQAADAFTAACSTHGVPAPQPAPDHDTTSHQYREALAPRPPVHIRPVCCPRLMLVDSVHAMSEAAWQELPDRHMHWAPTRSRQTGQWAPEGGPPQPPAPTQKR